MFSLVLVIVAAMGLIVFLIQRRIPVGLSILAGGTLIWFFQSRSLWVLARSAEETLKLPRTWDLLLCLYFVCCLEVELRTSGSLKGLVKTLRNIFSTNKVTLAVMPAFLGLLPSIGGARFSAPIVEEAGEGIEVSKEEKSAINLWFRHIFEFSNPLVPGMILTCGVANISIGELIDEVGWVTIMSFIIGWIYLIRPLKITDNKKATNYEHDKTIDWASLFLAFGPILLSFFLIVGFGLAASVSMGAVVLMFIPLYRFFKRPVKIYEVFLKSLDWKLFLNVLFILYFIQILTNIGTFDQIVSFFKSSPLPESVIIACLSFIFGLMTGMNQAFIAIVVPIVAIMDPGNALLVGTTIVFGQAGQMITPTHMCVLITVDYFKSDMGRTIWKCGVLSFWLVTLYSLVEFCRYLLSSLA